MSRYQERSIRIEPQQKTARSVIVLRSLAIGARAFPLSNAVTMRHD